MAELGDLGLVVQVAILTVILLVLEHITHG